MITIEQHNGVHVLRDDLLPGGTKSILLDALMVPGIKEYVYASPVYGGFQIALSMYCQAHGYKATIFCAKRAIPHPNTIRCSYHGAKIVEVPYGYLSVVEKRARDYADEVGAEKIVFGGYTPTNMDTIAQRMRQVTDVLGAEPSHVWCAVGSGTLIEGILRGTTHSNVHGVLVGADYNPENYRAKMYRYPRPFDTCARTLAPFPSMPNYDAKAWEYCKVYSTLQHDVLFWNVL